MTPSFYLVRRYRGETLVQQDFYEQPLNVALLGNLRHHFRVEVTELVDADLLRAALDTINDMTAEAV